MADLRPGWSVLGNDGRRVGTILEVGQNFVLASGVGIARDLYIPASAIANVQNEVVHLSLPQQIVADMGWEQPPRSDDAPSTAPESDLHRHI